MASPERPWFCQDSPREKSAHPFSAPSGTASDIADLKSAFKDTLNRLSELYDLMAQKLPDEALARHGPEVVELIPVQKRWDAVHITESKQGGVPKSGVSGQLQRKVLIMEDVEIQETENEPENELSSNFEEIPHAEENQKEEKMPKEHISNGVETTAEEQENKYDVTAVTTKADRTSDSRQSQRHALRLQNNLEEGTSIQEKIDRDMHLEILKDVSDRYQTKNNCFTRVVNHRFFDWIAAGMIILNSCCIAVETELLSRTFGVPFVLEFANNLCALYFLFELIFRIGSYGTDYFLNEKGRLWNLFDFGLVVMSILDFIVSIAFTDDSTMDVIRIAKTVKMFRIVRVLRVVRFLTELSLMASMVLASVKSLVWAVTLLGLVMLVFAICLTSNTVVYVKTFAGKGAGDDWFDNLESLEEKNVANVYANFGSLARTHYSLLKTMLGGVSWGELFDMLTPMDIQSPVLFICFVLFALLAVMNVVTGIFVDNAMSLAKRQKEFMIEKEREVKEVYVRELASLFNDLDKNNSQDITEQDMKALLMDPVMSAYFSALGFESHDCLRLFGLLDKDGDGSVDRDEFLDGCSCCNRSWC